MKITATANSATARNSTQPLGALVSDTGTTGLIAFGVADGDGFGAAWLAWYMVLLLGGGNDIVATHFHLSINAVTWFVRVSFFVLPVVTFIVTKRICLGLQRRDRDKVLHGRETGVIKRLPHGEFIEVHAPLDRERLFTLTQHEQHTPLELGPEVDENGVRRKIGAMTRLRAKLSQGFYGEDNQIPKPTIEEYEEITSGHGHH